MGLLEIFLAGLCINSTCTIPEDPVPAEFDATIEPTGKSIRFADLIQDLKSENLVVTTINNEKLSGVYLNDKKQYKGTGVAFDLLDILKDKFDFNYSIIVPQENTWGTGNGILELLKSKQANLSAAFLPVLREYNDVISYSPSLDTGQWYVLMKRPKESATGSGLLAPFTLPVWILILLSLLVVGPVIYFIIYIQAKLCKEDENKIFPLPACIWFVYGALLKQGTTLNPITDSSRLLFSTWWIFITILTAFYTANLTAFLTLSKFTLPISKPEDIGNKRSAWVTTKGNALEDSKSVIFSTLGDPQDYLNFDDSYILNEYVNKKGMMFIREKPLVEYTMYEDYKKKTKDGIEEAKRCTYVITDFDVMTSSRAFAYSKGFKYRKLFDNTIQYLVEAGIIKYKLREELPDTDICPLNLGSKERQLRNSDLMMTYEIVGGGFIISFIIFVIELIIQHWKLRPATAAKLFSNTLKQQKKNFFEANVNNNFYPNEFPFNSKFVTPPPSYQTLFNPGGNNQNIKRKFVNGRDYWVYDGKKGDSRMVPLRTPSALLFQFTR